MRKGEKMSPELRLKMSLSKKGSRAWNKGFKMPESMKSKMLGNLNGKGNKGRKFKQETLLKMSLAKIGKPGIWLGKKLPQSMKDKIGKSNRGRKQSAEEKEKNRQSQYRRHFRNNPSYIPDTSLDLRRKRIKESNTSHSVGEWDTLKAQYNWTCLCCKKQEPTIKLTRDHIIPISRGGSDNIENIQPLCHSCNCRKHTQIIKY